MKLKALIEPLAADFREILKQPANQGVKITEETPMRLMYDLLHAVSCNRAYSDEHPSFASGHWKRVLPYDGREYCFFYIDKETNDDHVATLLRKVRSILAAE